MVTTTPTKENASDSAAELDSEITQLINLLLKQHIESWYSNVTHDQELLAQFHALTNHSHITLAGRVQAIDWTQFFLHQLPNIVLKHLEDYNNARAKVRSDIAHEQAFFALNSHPGIEDQMQYLMNVADAILVILLPEDDLMSDIAYGFAREMLSDLVLSTVVDRLSEPWFWDQLLLRLHTAICAPDWLTYLHRRIKDVFSQACASMTQGQIGSGYESKVSWHRRLQQFMSCLSGWPSIFYHHPVAASRNSSNSIYDTVLPDILEELLTPSDLLLGKSILTNFLLPITDMLAGPRMFSVMQRSLEMLVCRASLTKAVRLARSILFPNDEPSPSPIIPSPEQQALLRAQVMSGFMVHFNLDFTHSKQVNKALLLHILDALLGTIFPELQSRSPEQLKDKMLRIRQANLEASGDGGIRTGYITRDETDGQLLGSPTSMSSAFHV